MMTFNEIHRNDKTGKCRYCGAPAYEGCLCEQCGMEEARREAEAEYDAEIDEINDRGEY